jgi:hypothetical protein
MSGYTGGCLCGAVRWRTTAEPMRVTICHCRMCQKNTGSAFGPYATFAAGDVVWEKGRPKQYRSSPVAHRGFCAECGSPLTFQFDKNPERFSLTLGSFDDSSRLKPALNIWTAEMLHWAADLRAIASRPPEQDKPF